MHETVTETQHHTRAGTQLPAPRLPMVTIVALGMGLGTFLALTFVLLTLFDLWFPALAMNPVWAPLLPGFTWISWPSLFLGLVETFAYGWYAAFVFRPLYNFFAAKFSDGS
jgi:hypothetical protein